MRRRKGGPYVRVGRCGHRTGMCRHRTGLCGDAPCFLEGTAFRPCRFIVRPVRGREDLRHLRGELARRIAGREPAQQPDASIPVCWLTEARERIEREASALPERVVAVAAGRVM